MKRKDSRLRIRIFYGILILPTVLWLLLSLIRVTKFLDYDTGEKRNKHEISEDANLSNITAELEAHYNDRVPFRSVMLSVNSTIDWLIELPYTKAVEPILIHLANASYKEQPLSDLPQADDGSGNLVTDGNLQAQESETDAGLIPEEVADTLPVLPPAYETPMESGYYPYKELASEVVQGRDGWLFITESYQDYVGGNMPSEEELAGIAAKLENLNQLLVNKGIEFHVFAVPNKNTVYPEYMPTLDHAEYSATNALEDYINTNTSASFHYLDDEMLGAKGYGQLYYRTDTHWNNRGGLAGYAYMRNTLGLPPANLSSVAAEESDDFYGDLIALSGLPQSNFEPDRFVNMLYKPEVGQELLRGGDDYIDEVVSSNTESDKTVVVVGDSYRHSLLPFISRDYAHIYSVNIAELNSEIMDLINQADILILLNVERNIFKPMYYEERLDTLTELMQ